MFTIESLLAAKLLSKSQLKKVISSELVLDEETSKVFLVFELKDGRVKKDGTYPVKLYKNDITKYVKNHGGVETLFKSLVVSEMMIAGYMLIPIPNGYICVGGDEMYDLKDNQCTCPAFINDSSKPCKHLLFRDGMLEYRSRVNEWKRHNLK